MTIIGDKNIKELTGEDNNKKTNKTRTILVKKVKMHPIYKKRFVVSKKYYAHDENNDSKIWNLVKIRECKPLSKLKKRKIVEILK